MSEAAAITEFVTEDDYFAAEELTEERSEYMGGCVYPMSVPTDTHGIISGNLLAALHALLRGTGCRAWMGNMRLRIDFPRLVHYFPDLMVCCDEPPRDHRFREQPVAIWEVLSKSSEAIDTREKRHAYITLPTLRHYFMVRQDRVEVKHLRRAGAGWEELTFTKLDQQIEVPEISFRITLAEIYVDAGL